MTLERAPADPLGVLLAEAFAAEVESNLTRVANTSGATDPREAAEALIDEWTDVLADEGEGELLIRFMASQVREVADAVHRRMIAPST